MAKLTYFSKNYGQKYNSSWTVPFLGYGRHGTCHGRHFGGGAKFAWQKLKCYLQFLEHLPCAPHIHKLQSCINNTAPLPNALRRACCASTTKHYDKTGVLRRNRTVSHCDRTRTLACNALTLGFCP